MLGERGYRPFEMSNVMFLPLSEELSQRGKSGSAVSVRVAVEGEADAWARTSAEGWSEYKEFAHLMLEMGRVVATAKGNTLFLAEMDGQVIGAGGLSIHDGVALFAGCEHDSCVAAPWGATGAAGRSISVCKGSWMRAGDDGCGAGRLVPAQR